MAERTSNFAIVPGWIFASGTWSRLSRAALAVYPVMCLHTNQKDRGCWPSVSRVRSLTGLSRRAVQIALRNLEQEGAIIHTHKRDRGHSRHYVVPMGAPEDAPSGAQSDAPGGANTCASGAQRDAPVVRTSETKTGAAACAQNNEQDTKWTKKEKSTTATAAAAAVDPLNPSLMEELVYMVGDDAQWFASAYGETDIRRGLEVLYRYNEPMDNPSGLLRSAIDNGWSRHTTPLQTHRQWDREHGCD